MSGVPVRPRSTAFRQLERNLAIQFHFSSGAVHSAYTSGCQFGFCFGVSCGNASIVVAAMATASFFG